VHYRVYGLRFLLNHGDMLGVKGGDGIIGAIGPIMRGEIKKSGQSAALGLEYDINIMGIGTKSCCCRERSCATP
jgi:hypothetical protein